MQPATTLLLAHRGIQTIKPKDSRGGQDYSGHGVLQRRPGFNKQRGAHSKPPHLYCEHRGTVFHLVSRAFRTINIPRVGEHCRNKGIRQ